MKVCSICKEEKELGEFHKNNAMKDKLSGKCKLCCKIYQGSEIVRQRNKMNNQRKQMLKKLKGGLSCQR